MIKIVLGTEALSRVRLTYSPMWEVACSLRLLIHKPEHRLHSAWLRWAGPRVDPDVVEILRALMPSPSRFPDFLTPPTAMRARSFRTELAAFTETDPAVACEEIENCWQGRPPKAVRVLLSDQTTLIPRLATALDQYWRAVLAPVWGSLRRVLTADLTYRADELAANGLHTLLERLHPTMGFDGQTLVLNMSRYDLTRHAGADGLVFVPCAFAWPEILIVDTEPYPVTISYAPRGVGTLWQTQAHETSRAHPAASLLGRSRAAILALLDLPLSTSQLAELTEMSAPAVSQHLAVLRENGLVEARRAGRMVLNTRTPLGHALLVGAGDP